jgi:Mg-chelatase subunit ChlI
MEVVEGDPFNSSPTDPKLMGPDALARFRAGEKLPAVTAKTPLVRCQCGLCFVAVMGSGWVRGSATFAAGVAAVCTHAPQQPTNEQQHTAHHHAHRHAQVELPLGATEDRICGTIDIEKALTEGVKAFEAGLLVGAGG